MNKPIPGYAEFSGYVPEVGDRVRIEDTHTEGRLTGRAGVVTSVAPNKSNCFVMLDGMTYSIRFFPGEISSETPS